MKLSPLLHIRSLYGGLLVLLTCLLIVGGTYRLQDAEIHRLQRENARLRDGLKYEASEHLRLTAEVAKQSSSGPITDGWRCSVVSSNTGDVRDEVATLREEIANREKTLKDAFDCLSIYERTYPEPKDIQKQRQRAIDAGYIVPGR
jgi:hypothetical protein